MRAVGDKQRGAIRAEFDRSISIDFQSAKITSDTGLLPPGRKHAVLAVVWAVGFTLLLPIFAPPKSFFFPGFNSYSSPFFFSQ
jgi:hypothetical protein